MLGLNGAAGRTLVVVVVLFSLLTLPCGGCAKSRPEKTMSSSSSVAELLASLTNLRPLGVESCSYTVEESSVKSMVPSPSDTKRELRGSAQLSEHGRDTISSRFGWTDIARRDVPAKLIEILPPGNLLYSQPLNESFEENPNFVHGFVVRQKDGDSKTIYFLATDMDHPIE